MKRWIFLLALCLCLNGACAFAEEPAAANEATEAPLATEAPQIIEATEAPDAEATATPEPDAGATPEAEPAADATAEPTPAPEATAEPTVQPDATATPEPAAEATATPAPEATDGIPADAEAWFEKDGAKVGGDLEDVVAALAGGEKVYIRAKGTLALKDAPLKRLGGVTLLPDPAVFPGEYTVNVSTVDPAGAEAPETVALNSFAGADDDAKADLYIWVAAVAPEATEEPTPAPQTEAALSVVAVNCVPGQWSAETPSFELSGIPEGADWTYAAIIYDERIIPLSSGSYVPEAEGVYTVRFAIVDGIGDIVDASEKYTLWLDRTAPETLEVAADEEKSYTLHITASDGMSGVEALSLDGGETWIEIEDGDTYTYTGAQKHTFAAGEIQARDAAGNIAATEEDCTAEKIHSGGGGGGGHGGGSGGGESKSKTHASGSGKEKADYDTVALVVPEGEMTKLTVGDETLDLTLALIEAGNPDAPVGEKQPFTAALASWKGGSASDTLVLSAVLPDGLGSEFAYAWRFNGEVYRKLANSGVKYVALRVGDDVAAFPTEGFTGGTKYTELKMQGVSTKKFNYTFTMKVNLDPGYVSALSDIDYSPRCDLSVRAEVEDTVYELGPSTQSVMFFYDVFLGPMDMLDKPFGEYAAKP